MKTSLNIEDSLFQAARKEAQKAGKTLSEMISAWARIGRETLARQKKVRARSIKAIDLGGPAAIDLNSRRDWMDALEE